MSNDNVVIANPSIVLREEYDDWAILFNPDTAEAFGINPVGVFIYRRLDGSNSIDGIVTKLKLQCNDMPENATELVCSFVKDLIGRGMADYQ